MSFVQFAVKGYEGNDIRELEFTQKNKDDESSNIYSAEVYRANANQYEIPEYMKFHRNKEMDIIKNN